MSEREHGLHEACGVLSACLILYVFYRHIYRQQSKNTPIIS